ncbi:MULTISPECIES: MOSC domain-containing protein [unclassified Chelatococcus]|uniref:MOSC domain-containing protein n=1 Tax=unclassified Chelatococcus TaxID=2638111 RepID=UPI001BCFBE1E|nr:MULTISPECIES: MOSC domain-containing protein [unclassified Chelatococcus]CAH1650989.1 Protein YiiM [Hyphomicrobiales bacterium]MBS7743232.1 MOSC domain-containing protein [Chelatococcus sp. HY11]MBX3541650.1 MOSC domain-containing protein [Chelatococcus sp.]MCO5074458.1 MOSC domain-containing protein [Chelatococcus sp.]CAH1692972.1 Protein YiiM [Hyphomicrobiales bacterium]
MMLRLENLLVGSVRPLGQTETPSGIDKHPVDGPLRLGFEGFEGDAQGDRRHHGGPDKAVHHYPFEHYGAWRAEIGNKALLAQPGAFGENLSIAGLDEAAVAIGDVFRLGSAVVEVTQGRQPCWKLNIRFGIDDMASRVQTSGRTGWYYRVIETGLVGPGDSLTLLDRHVPEWTIRRLWRLLYVTPLDYAELTAMADLPGLPESWRRLAERRLSTRVVEDWTSRLFGVTPAPAG